jgi:hypothetical protein
MLKIILEYNLHFVCFFSFVLLINKQIGDAIPIFVCVKESDLHTQFIDKILKAAKPISLEVLRATAELKQALCKY